MRSQCECGNSAVKRSGGYFICQRCANLESQRAQLVKEQGMKDLNGTKGGIMSTDWEHYWGDTSLIVDLTLIPV